MLCLSYLPVSMRSLEQQLSDIPLANAILIDLAEHEKSCKPAQYQLHLIVQCLSYLQVSMRSYEHQLSDIPLVDDILIDLAEQNPTQYHLVIPIDLAESKKSCKPHTQYQLRLARCLGTAVEFPKCQLA
jgi:hypothetical protein